MSAGVQISHEVYIHTVYMVLPSSLFEPTYSFSPTEISDTIFLEQYELDIILSAAKSALNFYLSYMWKIDNLAPRTSQHSQIYPPGISAVLSFVLEHHLSTCSVQIMALLLVAVGL